jgi:hypothetical protein
MPILHDAPIVYNETSCFSDSLCFVFPRWFVILGHWNGFKIPVEVRKIERGREREREGGREKGCKKVTGNMIVSVCACVCERVRVCVCVCVRERERKRERERERETTTF